MIKNYSYKTAIKLSELDALPPNSVIDESLRALASNLKIKFKDPRSVLELKKLIKDEYVISDRTS